MIDVIVTERATAMSVAVAGAYIRALRDGQKLTQMDVVRRLAERFPQLKVDPKTIWAIETDGRRSNSVLVAAIVRVLGGNSDDLLELLTDDTLTRADAIRRAETWLGRNSFAELERIAKQVPESQVEDIIEALRKLGNDPRKLARLAGYAQSLTED